MNNRRANTRLNNLLWRWTFTIRVGANATALPTYQVVFPRDDCYDLFHNAKNVKRRLLYSDHRCSLVSFPWLLSPIFTNAAEIDHVWQKSSFISENQIVYSTLR